MPSSKINAFHKKGQCFILQNVMDNSGKHFISIQCRFKSGCCCWNGAAIVQFWFFERKRMSKSAPDALHSPTKSMFSMFSLIPHHSYESHQESANICQTGSRHLTKNSHSRVDIDKVLLVCSQNLKYLKKWLGKTVSLNQLEQVPTFPENHLVKSSLEKSLCVEGEKRTNLILSSLLGKYIMKSKSCQLATKSPAELMHWSEIHLA